MLAKYTHSGESLSQQDNTMHVLNVMLGSGGGGIESAFADYTTMLAAQGHQVTCCIAPGAFIEKYLPAGATKVQLVQGSQFDPRAVWNAGALLRSTKPQVVITHGKRAFQIFSLARKLFARDVKLVNVLHRHRYKGLKGADRIITVSRTIREEAIQSGVPERKLVYIPNALMHVPEAIPEALRPVPVIGVLGRFVPEKGVDIFLDALALLKERNVAFTARIAGEGALKEELHQQAEKLGVAGSIEWLGWIDDVPTFYRSLDIFCLPSRSESFGIAVLGAMAHAKAVVSTRTPGPSEFLYHTRNALLCSITPQALACALAEMLAAPTRTLQLAAAARETALQFSAELVGKQLSDFLKDVAGGAAS